MHDNVLLAGQGHSVSPYDLPNVLTVIRLPFVSVFIWLMVSELSGVCWWVVLIFVTVASTDQLDGYVTRSRNLVTDFDKFVDPIADKALTLGTFVVLTVVGLLPWWVTALIAFRELDITWLRMILLKGGIAVAINEDDKLKAVLQMLVIWVLLISWTTTELGREWSGLFVQGMLVFSWTVAGLALVVTLWSSWVYVAEGIRLKKDAKTQSRVLSAQTP